MNERVKAILNFWFIETTSEQHFKTDHNFDTLIRNKFKNDYKKATNNELEDWQDNHKNCLALIILLDQFSRNLYRNNSLAYTHDHKTRLICNEAIDRGDLEKLNIEEKLYLILPLIHSEDISDHIFAKNLSETYLSSHPKFEEINNQFYYHSIPIKKFGRFPHRNKTLNRKSTEEENQFLLTANSSW